MHSRINVFLTMICLVCSNFCPLFSSNTPLYFVTAADSRFYPHLLNLIGSIHHLNYDDLGEIAVFDLGMTFEQKESLRNIKKLSIYRFESINPDITKPFVRTHSGHIAHGWFAFKYVAMKQALDKFPYVLWIDAGSTVLKPLNDLFQYLRFKGYILITTGAHPHVEGYNVGWGATSYVNRKYNLDSPENSWVLKQEPIMGGVQGSSRSEANKYLLPMYELARDLKNYEDDGTAPNGFGCGRHDQTLLSVIAYLKHLTVFVQDYKQEKPIILRFDDKIVPFYITYDKAYVCDKTHIYSSRGDLRQLDFYKKQIRLK
jgi:hypothetical protein